MERIGNKAPATNNHSLLQKANRNNAGIINLGLKRNPLSGGEKLLSIQNIQAPIERDSSSKPFLKYSFGPGQYPFASQQSAASAAQPISKTNLSENIKITKFSVSSINKNPTLSQNHTDHQRKQSQKRKHVTYIMGNPLDANQLESKRKIFRSFSAPKEDPITVPPVENDISRQLFPISPDMLDNNFFAENDQDLDSEANPFLDPQLLDSDVDKLLTDLLSSAYDNGYNGFNAASQIHETDALNDTEEPSCPLDQLLASQISTRIDSELSCDEKIVTSSQKQPDLPIPSSITNDPYQKFLLSFINGGTLEDDEDEEYQGEVREVSREQEEYRWDRETIIPKREVLDLLVDAYEDSLEGTIQETQRFEIDGETLFPFPFTLSQLSELRDQMKDYFQLTMQMFALTSYMKDGQDFANNCMERMMELRMLKNGEGKILPPESEKEYRYRKNTFEGNGEGKIQNQMINYIDLILSDGIYSFIGFKSNLVPDNALSLIKSRLYPSGISKESLATFCQQNHLNNSFFDTPGLHAINEIFRKVNGYVPMERTLASISSLSYVLKKQTEISLFNPSANFENKPFDGRWNVPCRGGDWMMSSRVAILPIEISRILFRFESCFKKDLEVRLKYELRCVFKPGEDNLLLMGLNRYGQNKICEIRRRYLPGKTERQIVTRYKNATANRAPESGLKKFYREKVVALTEKELLTLKTELFENHKTLDVIKKLHFPMVPLCILKAHAHRLVLAMQEESDWAEDENIKSDAEETVAPSSQISNYSTSSSDLSKNTSHNNPRNWTKEEDRSILNLVRQKKKPVRADWTLLQLEDRSPEELESRFKYLMELLAKRKNSK